ncbi:histidinol-phosphate transaminase [Gelidibacter sp.]|uniref:pyridoxal phosphate-dependent aminotransferase n=1 Tax=Gelidibacter sp. TaxID=2018083 RepID=UPI003265014B
MNAQTIENKYRSLKEKSGTHSPSLASIQEFIPDLKIKVDACFLSNPYATELFLEYFKKEMIDTGKINALLEFYPSQNNVIAGFIEKRLNIDEGHVFVGNGAIEAIQAIIHNYCEGKLMITIPTFSAYYEYAISEQEVVHYQLNKAENYRLDITDYIKQVEKEKPNTIVLINPNNPDGGYIKYDDLLFALDKLSWVKNIIIDESFIHFAYEDSDMELKSVVPNVINKDNVYVIKSMSKDFGIAGVRCGYAIMAKQKVQDLLKNGYLWNSNGLAEYFFRLYARQDFLDRYDLVRRKYITEALFFISELNQIKNIKVYPSRANFVLIELLNGANTTDVTAKLIANHGVYVRNCDDKIGLEGQFIRVAARSQKENKIIIKAIKEVIEG